FGVTEVHGVVDALDGRIAEAATAGTSSGEAIPATTLLRAVTPIGRIVLGSGIAGEALHAELDAVQARRAILVSEPRAWLAFGERLAADLEKLGREIVHVLLPEGEAAK